MVVFFRDDLKEGSEFSSLRSSGNLLQRDGSRTAKALSALVFSLERGIANRALSEDLKLRAGV